MSEVKLNSPIRSDSSHLSISQSKADSYVNAKGKMSSVGKEIIRLKLSNGSRFFIAAKIFNKESFSDRIYRSLNLSFFKSINRQNGRNEGG